MRHRAGDDPLSVKPAVEFILAALQISGVGSDRQECYEDALRRLTRAAQTGSTGPLSLIYRMHDALGKSVPSIIDVPNSLFDCAAGGSIAAFQDLDAVAADQVPSALNLCVRYTCPVGASFYADEKLLNEWKFSDLRERAWVEERLSRSTVPHEEVRVNVRGDRFLHAAAALGMSDIVQCLLEKYAMPVNLLNDMGETALICAVRSGHFDVAYRLLAKGASASIASQRGETALHWLISIHDNVIPGLIGALMARGGAETLTAAAQRCDYAAPKISINLDNIDLLTIGTPLHWAVCRGRAVFVSALLKHGAHPYYEDRASDVLLSPVQLASALHEPNILRLLVDKATGGRERPLQSIHETMRRAIDGSDRFYLIARHGVLYRSKMRETFVQLCRELRDGNVTVQDDCSPLQWAANGGFEEAASLILAHMTPSKMVNKRWGAQSETPIFAAVRRNHRRLVRLLREHGADPLLLIGSPGRADVQDWSLLHVAAESVFGTDCSMAEDILASGISPDGPSHEPADASETRLAIAVHAKAFNLARLLRMRGADVDAVCFHTLHGRAQLKWATTILGRVIAINLRNSRSTIDWLLRPLEGLQQGSATSCSFIVVPSCGLTALHLAALGESVFVEPLERDEETALDLLEYLLEYFGDEPTQLNQTDELGRTALHCAAQVGWKQGVLMLCQVDGMDVTAKDQMERTAMDVVLEMLSERSGNEVDDEWKEVIDILGDVATGANDLED
ncbi:MAG: hypothetical protein M1817_001183 [Caeruleum heppii]|nr:MAG: hypothetical protein M1817_001183 [Caeruleum heppii]